MDLDLARHKGFRFSRDGSYVAVGIDNYGKNEKPEVCVLRVSDGKRFDIADASYDFGSYRLEINPVTRTLYSGASRRTGITAYDFESNCILWERRDLKQLAQLSYDAHENVLYCLCDRRTIVLTASNGKEHAFYRNLNDVFFGRNSAFAVFNGSEVKFENRATKKVHVLPRTTEGILRVAFTNSAVVLSWVAGPVTAYDLETAQLLWTYKPDGDQAHTVATALDNASVWVAESPNFTEQPWQRIRLLSSIGEIKHEVRCSLGHSFEIAPYCDSVIRGNLVVTPISAL